MEIKLEPKKEDDTWIVTPSPGYVLKFKEVHTVGTTEKTKGFINVCHCTQLPPPVDDIDEDELAARIDREDYGFRIPICVGEVDCVDDKTGQPAVKVDILVNSVFYDKRLASADANFYRHFLCMVIAEALKNKHNIVINPNEAIKLNRKKMGEIGPMTIHKRPPIPVVQEIKTSNTPESNPLTDSLFKSKQPKNLNIRLLGGEKLEIKFCMQDVTPAITDGKRLKLKVGLDRFVVLLDNQRSLFDFCVPFNVDRSKVRSKFISEKNVLVVSAPIIFS